MPESSYREQAKQLADEYNVTPLPIAEKTTGEQAYQAAFTDPADYEEHAILITVWPSETVKEMTVPDLWYALSNEELTAIEAYPSLSPIGRRMSISSKSPTLMGSRPGSDTTRQVAVISVSSQECR